MQIDLSPGEMDYIEDLVRGQVRTLRDAYLDGLMTKPQFETDHQFLTTLLDKVE